MSCKACGVTSHRTLCDPCYETKRMRHRSRSRSPRGECKWCGASSYYGLCGSCYAAKWAKPAEVAAKRNQGEGDVRWDKAWDQKRKQHYDPERDRGWEWKQHQDQDWDLEREQNRWPPSRWSDEPKRRRVEQECGQSGDRGPRKSTEVCRDFQVGRCRYGENCKFQHVQISAKPIVKFYSVCRDFARGECRFKNCKYQHPTTHNEEKQAEFLKFVNDQLGSDYYHAVPGPMPSGLWFSKSREDFDKHFDVQTHTHSKKAYLDRVALVAQDRAYADVFNDAHTHLEKLKKRVTHAIDTFTFNIEKKKKFMEFLQAENEGDISLAHVFHPGSGMHSTNLESLLAVHEDDTKSEYIARCAQMLQDSSINRSCIADFNERDVDKFIKFIKERMDEEFVEIDAVRKEAFQNFLAEEWRSRGYGGDLPAGIFDVLEGTARLGTSYEQLFDWMGTSEEKLTQYLHRVARCVVRRKFYRSFNQDTQERIEGCIQRVLDTNFICSVCQMQLDVGAPAEHNPLCKNCARCLVQECTQKEIEKFEQFLRKAFNEHKWHYENLKLWDQLKTGYVPDFTSVKGLPVGNSGRFETWMLTMSDPRYKSLPESHWNPRKILEWGRTFLDLYLADCLKSALKGAHLPHSRESFRQRAQYRIHHGADLAQRTLQLHLKECFDEIKPHTVWKIHCKLRDDYGGRCTRIHKTFQRIFLKLRELDKAAKQKMKEAASNATGHEPESNAFEMEGADAEESKGEESEFTSKYFRWDDDVPEDRRITIACRYYMWRKHSGKLEVDEESVEASDRRMLVEVLMKRLVDDGHIQKMSSDLVESRELFWRPGEGGIGCLVHLEVEDGQTSAVHMFHRLDQDLNEQQNRIFKLFGELNKTDFTTKITYRNHGKEQWYPTVGVTPTYRDREECGKAQSNFLIIDGLPQHMQDVLNRDPVAERPSLREFVGFSAKKTHRNSKLSREVFVGGMQFERNFIQDLEKEMVKDIMQKRFESLTVEQREKLNLHSWQDMKFEGASKWDGVSS
eukprot:gnl/MRDRNA2_/MRDRNA2_86805_c0_seq13.p1 gnl/MRDRNA2_/MRDRNA2_86805_c0~~gnl/MRDRNA2_/MRDRNA2_86805_c0_seq13.p1  ORF type:complete len:1017 (+),score=174.25 gnl/MRDRNA2_/MRDRNA2_86805_c0_seq13:62-3112(+)